jgi:N-acetylneuraminate lyase
MPNPLLAAENRILPALVTPLTPDRQLDERSTQRLIDHLYAQGVGGLYVTGTTGEGIHLDSGIRQRLVEIAVHGSQGRGQVIVHVGATQASAVFDLAAHAARAGADAISSIPPFAGGYVWDEIHAFYAELARRSELPVVAYHFPGLTGQQTSLAQLASMLSIPNVAGLKFTDPNFYVMQRLLTRLSPEQVLYNGQDEALALGLSIGAHGGIGSTYNFMPALIVSIFRDARAGRTTQAIATQRQANAIIEAVLTCQIVAATKQILYWQGHIEHPTCAFPRAPLSEVQQRKLRDLLAGTAIGGTLVR